MDGKVKISANIYKEENNRNCFGYKDNRFLFSTESNIVNMLGVHEYIGHGVHDLQKRGLGHIGVYNLQMNSESWFKTTEPFRKYIRDCYSSLLKAK